MGFGSRDEKGAEGSHFGFELSGGSGWVLGFEAVGADEFGKVGGFVGGCFVGPAHFIEGDFEPVGGADMGAFGACHSTADDVNHWILLWRVLEIGLGGVIIPIPT